MEDKREHPRVDKEVKSEVHGLEGMTFSTSRDLSSGGLFISTPEPVMVGAEIDLLLHIPGEEAVNVKGVVRWMREEEKDGKKAGMGIEFIDKSDSNLDKIKKIIE